MANNPLNAYSRNVKSQVAATGDGSRETDLRAVCACTHRLDDARTRMDADQKSRDNLRLYSEAIRHNQRLWTIWQVALCDPMNPLPENLKTTLLNLSRYVDKVSFEAVGKYRPDLIESLITINRSIAAGLSKEPALETVTPAPTDTRDIPTYLTTSV